MPRDDYVPAPLPPDSPDHTFDPATLYQTELRASLRREPPPEPPAPVSRRARRLSLALALFGATLLVLGARRVAHAEATRGWMETRALILSANIRATPGGDYHLDVVYRYRAGLREHQAERLAFQPDRTREGVYARAARYRPGALAPAWFDPARPASAVLERPQVKAPWAPALAGAAITLAGLAAPARWLARWLAYQRARRLAAAT